MSSENNLHTAVSREIARRRFAGYAWCVLAFHIAVVLWGAYVRATGSGAGCGGHWPLCNGELIPRAPQLATIIEFTHRLTSGLAIVLIALLLFFAFRVFPRGHAVRRAAFFATAFTASEGLLGAALVLLGFVARNTSVWRGLVLGVHLVNTLLLLASVAVTAWLATGPEMVAAQTTIPARTSPQFSRLGWAWRLAVAGLLLTGVSGAVAALGDTLFASSTLAQGLRLDFSASAHPFVRARILHPLLAVALAACLLVVASICLYSEGATRAARRLASALIALTFVQLCLGAADVLLMAPVWLQLLHLLGADLLAITFVLLSTELLLSRRAVPPRSESVRRMEAVEGG